MGRPKSAVFRTGDLSGIDTLVHVADNLYENVPNDDQRETFRIPGSMREMVKRGWMGVEYALFRRGPLTMAPSQLGLFTRSSPDYATPNLQFHIQPLSLDAFGDVSMLKLAASILPIESQHAIVLGTAVGRELKDLVPSFQTPDAKIDPTKYPPAS